MSDTNTPFLPDHLHTLEELAPRLGLSRDWLWICVETLGILHGKFAYGRWVVSESAVQDFIQNHSVRVIDASASAK